MSQVYRDAFEMAESADGLLNALTELKKELAENEGLRESMPKQDVIALAMAKRKATPSIWTPAVAAAFGEVLATYSKPVYPKAAYPGQEMPPSYLFGLPPPPDFDSLLSSTGSSTSYPSSVASYPSSTAGAGTGAGAGNPAPSAPPAPGSLVPEFHYAPPPDSDVSDDVKKEIKTFRLDTSHETELVFTDGGEITTGELPCKPEKCHLITHINLWNNDVSRIEGLEKYPNLMRLTLKSNDITHLTGLDKARALRWLDVSDNDVKEISGLANMPSLEWLNLSNNDIAAFSALSFCPRLTYVNLHHNDLSTVAGIDTLPALMKVDLSSNDLKSVKGLEGCKNLRELDLSENDLNDADSIIALARGCPRLSNLDLRNNDLTGKQLSRIRSEFKKADNYCTIVADQKGGGCVIQ